MPGGEAGSPVLFRRCDDVRRHRRVMSVPPRKCRRDGVEGAIQSRRVAPLDFRAEGRAEHQPVSGVASVRRDQTESSRGGADTSPL